MSFLGLQNAKPMVVAIWCGKGKPILNEYLHPFVSELNSIISSGIQVNNYRLSVAVHGFICDTPARSFLKGD